VFKISNIEMKFKPWGKTGVYFYAGKQFHTKELTYCPVGMV
jgi:hypothetical protein